MNSTPSSVRAKFTVSSIEASLSGGTEMKTVKLTPVFSGSEENKQFFKWTPSGRIELGVLNGDAAKAFNLGQEFYVDFTPASPSPVASPA